MRRNDIKAPAEISVQALVDLDDRLQRFRRFHVQREVEPNSAATVSGSTGSWHVERRPGVSTYRARRQLEEVKDPQAAEGRVLIYWALFLHQARQQLSPTRLATLANLTVADLHA